MTRQNIYEKLKLNFKSIWEKLYLLNSLLKFQEYFYFELLSFSTILNMQYCQVDSAPSAHNPSVFCELHSLLSFLFSCRNFLSPALKLVLPTCSSCLGRCFFFCCLFPFYYIGFTFKNNYSSII